VICRLKKRVDRTEFLFEEDLAADDRS